MVVVLAGIVGFRENAFGKVFDDVVSGLVGDENIVHKLLWIYFLGLENQLSDYGKISCENLSLMKDKWVLIKMDFSHCEWGILQWLLLPKLILLHSLEKWPQNLSHRSLFLNILLFKLLLLTNRWQSWKSQFQNLPFDP